jgi:tetratricopeptide (TPR) repeat protein
MRYTKVELRKAFIEADRLLHMRPVSVTEVEAILKPYHDCTGILDNDGETADSARSMIFALTADAYRAVGDMESAAEWYRQASNISPGGHYQIYAHLVVKHGLSGHYADALAAVELGRQRWEQRPIGERVRLKINAWRMWLDPEGREISASKDKNLQFLRQHVPA